MAFGKDGGHNLLGLVIGTGPVGIILGHQVDGTLCTMMPVAKQLADRGYRVLAFDFNGFGLSESTETSIDEDLGYATAFLRADGATSVVLIGCSMGGTASIVAAAAITPPVTAVVELSGPVGFGNVSISGLDAAAKLTMPALYIASSGDVAAGVSAQAMYDQTPVSLRTIALFSGQEHGVALLADSGSRNGWTALDPFLAKYAPATAA